MALSVGVSVHCKEPITKIRNKYSQKRKLRSHSSNFHIHVSVSDLYIPTVSLPILLEEICGPILGKYKSLKDMIKDMNVVIGTEGRAIPRKGIYEWDFRCSVIKIDACRGLLR
jgi:hypothetical protein